MDAQVLRAQQWLNQNYGDNPCSAVLTRMELPDHLCSQR